MESLTTTLQAGGGALGILVGLNTQLMPGAATLTTVRGAACAPEAVPKHPAAAMAATRIGIFTVICFLSKKNAAEACMFMHLKAEFGQHPRQRPATPTTAVLAGFRLHLAPGAARPVLPGAVERVRCDPADDLVDLARGEELDLAHRHRLHLQLGAELEINRDENRVTHRAADHGGAVAAH